MGILVKLHAGIYFPAIDFSKKSGGYETPI